jgi:hypothetical protein
VLLVLVLVPVPVAVPVLVLVPVAMALVTMVVSLVSVGGVGLHVVGWPLAYQLPSGCMHVYTYARTPSPTITGTTPSSA